MQDTQDPSRDENSLVVEEYLEHDILRPEPSPYTDPDKLLEVALQRRWELRERCLRELWERFQIEVTETVDRGHLIRRTDQAWRDASAPTRRTGEQVE